jgi:NAD(P)-dependent dehydrogenase (short-subunit alcohol dehydrogenase family)
MQLSDVAAVVTGGASGLGAAFARRIIGAGGRVVILDVPTSRGAGVADELGANALFVAADVTDDDAIAAAFGQIGECVGHVNTVLNAAGGCPVYVRW